MEDVGRPTVLTDELCLKIRQLVLAGKNLTNVAKLCDIPYKTMEGWIGRNFEGFADKWELYQAELKLKKANRNINEFLDMDVMTDAIGMWGPIVDKKTGERVKKINVEVLKVKKDASLFVAETVGKVIYSKRSELTGPNGKELKGNSIVFTDFRKQDEPNNSDKQSNDTESE